MKLAVGEGRMASVGLRAAVEFQRPGAARGGPAHGVRSCWGGPCDSAQRGSEAAPPALARPGAAQRHGRNRQGVCRFGLWLHQPFLARRFGLRSALVLPRSLPPSFLPPPPIRALVYQLHKPSQLQLSHESLISQASSPPNAEYTRHSTHPRPLPASEPLG